MIILIGIVLCEMSIWDRPDREVFYVWCQRLLVFLAVLCSLTGWSV